MRKFCKRFLSVFLALAIIFASMYVGLNELDFNSFLVVETNAAAEDGLTFALNSDESSYTITGYNDALEINLVIPGTYNGMPVTGIGSSALSGSSVVTVEIPERITTIGNQAFSNCNALTEINVNSNNTEYTSENGVLFNKGKTHLIQYPIGSTSTEYVIPETVETIGDRAFFYAGSLASITFPEKLTSIGSYAFYKCTNITSVTFYKNLSTIAANAFNYTGITDVYYYGTVDSWNETTLGSGNTVLTDATFHHLCTYNTQVITQNATCTENGEAQLWCDTCNDNYIIDSIPATGHYFVDNNCTNCGETLTNAVGGIIQTGTLQSAHPYSNNANQTKTFTAPGADYVKIIFSSSTYVEPANDYIYIYDADDNQIGKYTNEDLDSKTITVNGDTVKIKLTSDSSVTYYGYYATCEGWITPVECNNHLHKKLINAAEADCESTGHTGDLVCAVCDTVIEAGEIIPSPGHSYADNWTIDLESTCTTDGSKSKTCSACGDVITEVIPATGHYFENDTCVYCGDVIDVIKVPTVIKTEVLESDHNYGDNTNETKTFTAPGAEYVEVYFSTSTSTESGWDFIYIYDSTGEQIGEKHSGTTLAGTTITVYGDTVKIVFTTDTSNTDYGYHATCKAYKSEAPCNDHLHKKLINVAEADCDDDGYTGDIVCAGCEEVFENGEILPASGHSYSEDWTIDLEPTCDSDGSKSHVCTICGDKTDITVIDALGHSYPDEWTIDVVPTCTESGSKSKTCSTCGEVVTEEISPLAHYFENDVCVKCDKTLNVALGGQLKTGVLQSAHNYANYENQTKTFSAPGAEYIVIAFSSSTSVENSYDYIYIYDENDSQIGSYTGSTLASQVITVYGDTVKIKLTSDGSQTRYGYKATCTAYSEPLECNNHMHQRFTNFIDMDCTQNGYTGDIVCAVCGEILEEGEVVPSPGHVYSDGYCTTCGTEKEYEYIVENGSVTLLSYLGSDSYINVPFAIDSYPVTTIGENTFYNCTSVIGLTIPDSVTVIGDRAFRGCTNLEEVIIPEGVTTIGANAFQGCKNLFEVTIPASVTGIGDNAFSFCSGLTCINVEDDNTVYSSLDGVLFDEDQTTLIRYPINSGSYEVVIPDTVTTIYANAFQGCDQFDSIIISESVVNIEAFAFDGCASLKYIYYLGTESDWNNIEIGKNNTPLTTNNIHFNTVEHSFEEIIDTEATCDEDGVKHQECSVCGYESDIETIPALGHDYSEEWTIDYPATCTDSGYKSRHCLICDEATIDDTYIDPYGHNYVVISESKTHPHTITYECSLCYEELIEEPVYDDCFECKFTVEKLDSNSYKLVSYVGYEEIVEIPSEYNGKPITTIGKSCFKGNEFITTVKIPYGITTIDALAFVDCEVLEKVYIPTTVTNIGSFAFSDFKGTIYCFSDSFAHEYAVANELNFILVELMEKEYTIIDYENFIIRTGKQNCDEVSDLLSVSGDIFIAYVASYINGNLELLGTGSTITIFDGNEYIGDFTLIVEGDTNGDSVCDVLDCVEVERASKDMATLTGAYAMAADSNGDEIIDIYDYQAITNVALS